MRYYLGLDNGGTVTKAALFDSHGRQVGSASVPTAVRTPKPGFAERDMEEMWQANCTVIRTVLEATKISSEQVAGVGICGHGKGLYLWGKDDKPAYWGIPSSDNRAYAYPQRWAQDGTEEQVLALSCQHIMACQPVALLAWLKDHEPEVLKNVRYIFACKDYVRFRLTGEAWAEQTDSSGDNFVNLYTGQYDRKLLELFGIEELWEALPPLRNSADICGSVTEEAAKACGLLPGTPVVAGMFDINACALAANVVDEDYICMIAGTWSINEYPRRTPVVDGSVQMNSLFCLPGYYLIEESSATSAGNQQWFVSALMKEIKEECNRQGSSVYDITEEWVSSVPPETFVPVFLPFLMASNVHPNAKSCFVGMCANHERKHLLRGVYEGIAFCHRYHLEKLLATRETAPKAVRLAGGAANSPVWTQMFADILGYPVETVEAKETGALGCAMAAAYATGEYASLEEASAAMCKITQRRMPNPERKSVYDQKYALYCKVIEALDCVWSQMQQLAQA